MNILFLILVAIESINPFLKKEILNKKISSNLFYYIASFLIFIFVNIYYFILFLFRKFDYKDIKKIELNSCYGIIFSSIMTIMISQIHINVLKKIGAKNISILEKPMVLIFSLFLARFVFKEKINKFTYLGALLIVIGIICTKIK